MLHNLCEVMNPRQYNPNKAHVCKRKLLIFTVINNSKKSMGVNNQEKEWVYWIRKQCIVKFETN